MVEEHTITYAAVLPKQIKPENDQMCRTVLFDTLATSHIWLLSTWYVASMNWSML